MSVYLHGMIAYFSSFLGVYLLCSAVFIISLLKTNGKEFRSFLGLSLSICCYLLGGLFFSTSGDAHFNSNFIFPLQSLFGASAFYFYLRSVRDRLFLIDRAVSLLEWTMLAIIFLSFLCLALFISDIYYPFEISGKMSGNNFIDAHTAPWTPKLMTKSVFAVFPIVVMVGNIYLLYRFLKMKLSGLERLMTVGVVMSLISNLNDNLMGAGILNWTIPSIHIGYLLETFYFLTFSLRSISSKRHLQEASLKSKRPVLNKDKKTNTVSNVFAYAATAAFKKHSHLDILLETSLGEDFIGPNKEEGLLVVFYHLISEILDSIERSPLRRGKIELAYGGSPNTLMILEDSPSNYLKSAGQASPELKPLRVMKVAEVFGLELRAANGEELNKYTVRF